jgi:N-acylneuraminate cytidylyltransferase
MNRICIIPARGGSKRIPRKNIRPFLGRPIIACSIDAALESGLFDVVMVSTEDEEIAGVARSLGAEVPFPRSEENSGDMAMTVPVLLEVLDRYEAGGVVFPVVCCLYPTAPFVTSARLRQASELLEAGEADAVVPVVRFSYPIQRALRMSEEGTMRMFWPENYNCRSQDLEPAYHDAGQFYFLRTAALRAQRRLFPDTTIPVVLPESEVQDIDSAEDWAMAEWKCRWLREQGGG